MNWHIHTDISLFHNLNHESSVYDDRGCIHYYVKHDSSWMLSFGLYDLYGNRLVTIRNRFGLQPSRYIEFNGAQYKLMTTATFPPEFRCYIEGTNYCIVGRKVFLKRSFRIPKYWVYYGQKLIMYFENNQSPNINAGKDMIYDLKILDQQHEWMCICIALSLMW